jgi:hypothetical protein
MTVGSGDHGAKRPTSCGMLGVGKVPGWMKSGSGWTEDLWMGLG